MDLKGGDPGYPQIFQTRVQAEIKTRLFYCLHFVLQSPSVNVQSRLSTWGLSLCLFVKKSAILLQIHKPAHRAACLNQCSQVHFKLCWAAANVFENLTRFDDAVHNKCTRFLNLPLMGSYYSFLLSFCFNGTPFSFRGKKYRIQCHEFIIRIAK